LSQARAKQPWQPDELGQWAVKIAALEPEVSSLVIDQALRIFSDQGVAELDREFAYAQATAVELALLTKSNFTHAT